MYDSVVAISSPAVRRDYDAVRVPTTQALSKSTTPGNESPRSIVNEGVDRLLAS